MANTYKEILITPYRGDANNNPTIRLSSGDATTNSDMNVRFYAASNGTLSFEGPSGQMFSVTNDMTGSIFSVNDISGLPIIDVNANTNTTISARSFLSNSAPALSITDTWANSALTFTGMNMNVTDTNSATGSLLTNIRTTSRDNIFAIRKAGATAWQLMFDGVTRIYSNQSNDTFLCNGNFVGTNGFGFIGSQIRIRGDGSFAFSATDPSAAADTILSRGSAATFQLGAADAATPNAQTLQVQSVVAGTSNTAGQNFTINGSRGTGTGAGGSIIFQVAPAGTTGTAQNALVQALTIDSNRNAIVGGVLSFTSSGYPSWGGIDAAGSQRSIRIRAYNQDIAHFYQITGIITQSTMAFAWSSGSDTVANGPDLLLYRDAANTLALRRSTNAQTFRIYNTYTDAANYERAVIDWATTANTVTIGTQSAGTGIARNVALVAGGNTAITISSSLSTSFAGNISGPNNFFISSPDGPTISKSGVGSIRFCNSNNDILGGEGYSLALTITTRTNDSVTNNLGIYGQTARSSAVTNITGGAVVISGGGGASASAAAANGGNIIIDGGQGYGTGANGKVVIGSTRATLTTFGGTTSSFPALKPSGKTLQVRLADDSANADFSCANATFSGVLAGYAPNRPAFRVYGANTSTNLTTTQNGTGQLNNNNWATDFNQGTYLDISTGTFTAPVAGLYQVNVVGRNSGYTSGISQLAVVKNPSGSNQVMCMLEFAANSSMNHAGVGTVCQLVAGDTLVLKVLAGEINFDGNDNWSVSYIG